MIRKYLHTDIIHVPKETVPVGRNVVKVIMDKVRGTKFSLMSLLSHSWEVQHTRIHG